MKASMMSRRARILATSGVLALVWGGASWAAETAPAQVEEVVVTAQRRSEDIQTVPISMQALSAETLRAQGVAQVQDLQKATPNVTITSPLGAGSAPAISIRGIGLNDFNTNNSGPNGVYVDEFAVSSPNAQGLSFFDLQRVEVLKGPQGTLYGLNASGGAVNITTAKPTPDFAALGHVAYSSYDTVDAEGAVSGAITDTLSGRLSAMYKSSEGYMYNHLYNRHESGTNMWGLRGQLDWRPTENFKALLKVQTVANDTRAPMYKAYGMLDPATGAECSVKDTLANNCVDLFGYAGRKGLYEGDWDNGNRKLHLRDYNATLRTETQLPNDLTLVTVTGLNYNHRLHPENSDAAPQRALAIDFQALSREVTQEVRLSRNSDQMNWVVGAFYMNEKIKQDQPVYVLQDLDLLLGPGGADGVGYIQQAKNNQNTETAALFGQLDYKLTDALTLIAGARYTDVHKRFDSFSASRFQNGGMDHYGPAVAISEIARSYNDSNVSWRLGANYQFNPDVMLFATASTGYKSGGFNGGFLSQDPAQRAIQLKPFKSEKVTAYEAGFKSRLFDRRVTFNASVFYNDYQNEQVSLLTMVPTPPPQPPQILFVLDNAQKSRIYGLDADLTWRVSSDLTLSGQLGYIDAKMTKFRPVLAPGQPDYSGNRLSLAPKITSSLVADYKHPVGPGVLGVQYSASYRSKQFFEPSNSPYLFQDGYWLQNARVSYAFKEGRYEVAAFARNLANKGYLIWNSSLFDPFGVTTGTPGEPRFVGVEFNYHY